MVNAADFFADGQQIMKLKEKVLGEVAKDHCMSRTELEVLLCLAENPTLDTAKEIVESRRLTKSCVSRAVDSLVRQGYLLTREDASDRRIIHLTVEEKAAEVIRLGLDAQSQMAKSVCQGISAGELEAFQRTHAKMMENTRAALGRKF